LGGLLLPSLELSKEPAKKDHHDQGRREIFADGQGAMQFGLWPGFFCRMLSWVELLVAAQVYRLRQPKSIARGGSVNAQWIAKLSFGLKPESTA
jgi:hypothetical protein